MVIAFEEVDASLRRIALVGRLDIAGTDAIATRFAALTAVQRRIIVDLTGVTFLASIGIRSVISNAKALQQRGGRMVLYVGDNAAVTKTLEATGIDTLIPMHADSAEAVKAALS